jgi:hypothetical protein
MLTGTDILKNLLKTMECHMRVIESENDEVILKQSLSIDKSQICIWP